MLFRKLRHIGKVRRRQKPLLAKRFQIDEQRVSGKSREALIRRVAISRGIQRQHLPDFLPCSGQEFDELMSRISQIADAVAARQRGDMEKDSAAPGKHDPINVRVPMQLRNREKCRAASSGDTLISPALCFLKSLLEM